jgi:hypothetical protein
MKRHRHQEFIRFLNAVDPNVPAKKAVHAIIDNYAAHKHPRVIEWLDRHPRFAFLFTPTSASWFNAVEGFFAKVTSNDSNAAYSDPSRYSKPPSTAPSPTPTKIRSPLPGRKITTKSSPPSNEGTKRQIRSTKTESAYQRSPAITIAGPAGLCGRRKAPLSPTHERGCPRSWEIPVVRISPTQCPLPRSGQRCLSAGMGAKWPEADRLLLCGQRAEADIHLDTRVVSL